MTGKIQSETSSFPLVTQVLAGRVFEQVCDLAQDGRDVSLVRMPVILAGIVAETLMDFDEPEKIMADVLSGLPLGQAMDAAPQRSLRTTDFDLALGRSLARYHLGETDEEQNFALLRACLEVVTSGELSLGQGDDICAAMVSMFREALLLGVNYDLSAHSICNRTIDVKIANQHWSLADCIIALSGLSGALLGRVLADVGIAPQSAEEQLNELMDMMTAEAIRHGFADKDMAHPALPANDNPTHVRYDLIRGIEHLSLTVLEELDVRDVVVQAHALAKAAGRMVAVASVGDSPEIEGYVSRPMALLAMQGGFAASL